MVIPNTELAYLQTEKQLPDRIMFGYLSPEHAEKFKNHPVSHQGVIVRVFQLRAGSEGVEVLTGYGDAIGWFPVLAIELQWDICDGCKNRLS